MPDSTLPKILVVDDTHANLVAMRRLLGQVGANIHEARSGNDALALCLDHDFALILLDVNMPDMDGFEVATLLGDTQATREVPIIFVTAAYADDMNRLKGYRSGAVDYIAKPINDVILQSKVRIFLDLHNARAQLQHALDELSRRNAELREEIAERHRIEATVRHQATHDALTGLPNRALFRTRLTDLMASVSEGFALAMLDIDGFKAVNDGHGHPVGDALLQAIAGRLSGHLRAPDLVARLGGDEFALLLPGAIDSASLQARCQQLVDALAQPYGLHSDNREVTVRISASLGVVAWQGERSDAQLIQVADRALYRAKETGKNRCVLAADVAA